MKVCLNGKFLPVNKAKISVLDNGLMFGDGFYETMRTYDGKILELDLHLKRLQKTAAILGIILPAKIETISQWTEKLAKVNKLKAARLRITITRGNQGFNFLACKKATLIITSENLNPELSVYKNGVSVFTQKLERPIPDIKMLGLTVMIMANRFIEPRHGYESILLTDKNIVREGASTNIFVVKNDVVFTPKNNILFGLTRNRVLALAKNLKLKIVEKDFDKDFLLKANEIFLTNRPREIIPVVKIDGKKVGNGTPGNITKIVMAGYQNYISEYFKKTS